MNVTLYKKPIYRDTKLESCLNFQAYFQHAVHSFRNGQSDNNLVTISSKSNKVYHKNVNAKVWMSQDFPINIS